MVNVTCSDDNIGVVEGSIDVHVIEEKLGAYVGYDVEYTDVYTDHNYTNDDGKRVAIFWNRF